MNKRIIVFAPHPDDETFGCGGTIAKKISEGYDILVVVLTDGRNAFSRVLNIKVNPSPEEIKRIRREEVTKATGVLGLPTGNLLFCDIEDGTLEAQRKEVEKKICEVLKKYPPAEIYYPIERDANPDHRVTNVIVRTCVKKLELTPARYQYSITHMLSRLGPKIERFIDIYNDCIVDVDISEYLDLKREACDEFKSEISIISGKQKKPIEKNPSKYLKSKERFYIDKS